MRKQEKTPAVIERFLTYKREIQARGAQTTEQYRSDLHVFFRYLTAKRQGLEPTEEILEEISLAKVDEAFVKRVTTLEILEFLMYTAETRGNSAASRARKLSAIKAFFKYLTATERLLEKNPAIDIEAPRKAAAPPKSLSKEESIALLERAASDEDDHYRERNFCILTLFLNCGMRLSELVGIDCSDLDEAFRSLRVRGRKERIVYLNQACAGALRAYLDVRGSECKQIKDENALFLSRLGKRISPKTVQWVVYQYLEKAGLDKKQFSAHKLRHTAATLMYQSGGVDVTTLGEILGHTKLSTTQMYTHVTNERLEDAAAQNPLANIRPKPKKTVKKEENGGNEEK